MNLLNLTAAELAAAIKDGKATAVEAVRASLERIEEKEELYHCYVTIDKKGALLQAEAVQSRIEKGELTGPLAGVPAALKDNLCTEGMPTTCSSRILGNFVPAYSAEAVLNLKKAGAVILHDGDFGFRRDEESLESGACARRFFRRFRGGGSGGRVLLCSRFRYGRLYQTAGFLLRDSRHETDLRHGVPLWADCLWLFP